MKRLSLSLAQRSPHRSRRVPLPAARAQAVQAPTKSDVGNVNDVGLKDVPLRSLFPEEPAAPRPVRVDRPRQDWTGCDPAARVAVAVCSWAC